MRSRRASGGRSSVQVARPLGHARTIERLFAAAAGGRLPHALLFEGRAGIGKFQAARWFAMGCLCERGPAAPCLVCGSCRRVASGGERGNHPDLFVIDPLEEGEERIRVGRIVERGSSGEDESREQSLESFLGLRPMEGSWRVVLVRECQRMNVQAQNALLKMLEEPRAGTLMVLETHRPSAMLPTIKSRCIRIRFDALTRAECEQVLGRAGVEEGEARELARLAEGSPGLALGMTRNGTRAFLGLLQALAVGDRPPREVALAMWELEGEFPGKSKGASDRERSRVVLELAQLLVRDAARAAAGVALDELALGEMAGALAHRLGERELARRARLLSLARSDVEHNLSPTSVLERGLLALAEGAPDTVRAL